MEKYDYVISILIRNRNEGENLRKLLFSIRQQRVSFPYEVVVVDNESSDDSKNIAIEFGCKLLSIQRSEFSYGRSLNLGMSHCKGQYVLSISAHVVLLGKHFLGDLYETLQTLKNDVAGMRFIAVSDIKSHVLENNASSLLTPEEFICKNIQTKVGHWKKLLVSNCSLYRRSCWEHQPFDEDIIANEDKKWSIQQLEMGFTIMYDVPLYYLYHKNLLDFQSFKRKNVIETITMMSLLDIKRVNRLFCLSFTPSNFLVTRIIKHERYTTMAFIEAIRPLLGAMKKVLKSALWNARVNYTIGKFYSDEIKRKRFLSQ